MMRIRAFIAVALLLSTLSWSFAGTGSASAFNFSYESSDTDPTNGESSSVACESIEIQDAMKKFDDNYTGQLLCSALEQVERMLKAYAPQIAICLATSLGILGSKPPEPFNCMVSVGGEMGNQLEKQYLNKLKQDFTSSCTARSSLIKATNDARKVIAQNGRDGGPAFVEDWQSFQAQSRNRGRKTALNQMANTDFCPWLQAPLQGMFGFSAADAVNPANTARDGGPSYMDTAACNAPNGYNPFDPKWQTAEGLAIMMQPQNNIWGAYLLAQENMSQQIADVEKQDENEFVHTGGLGALRTTDKSTGTSCRIYTADGSTCLEYNSIRQPAAGLQAEIQAQRQAEYDWMTRSGTEPVTNPYSHLMTSLLDATTDPIEPEYKPSTATKSPSAKASSTPPPDAGSFGIAAGLCSGGGGPTTPSCTYETIKGCGCLGQESQSLATGAVQSAVLAAAQQQIGISVSPDGNSVLPGQERLFLDAVCNAGGFSQGSCRINGSSTTEILIAGGVYDFVVSVLSGGGAILKPGSVVAACTTGTL